MPRLYLSMFVLLAATGSLLSACSPAAPPASESTRASEAAEKGIVGSWELQTRTVRDATGQVVNDAVLGSEPIGRLFYGDSGHMALQMMRQGRSAAVSRDVTPDAAGNPRALLGYDAYFGTYSVDEAAGTVTHRVVGSLFPEDLGRDFVRNYRLNGDTFELSFTSPSAEGTAITRTLVFRRSRR